MKIKFDEWNLGRTSITCYSLLTEDDKAAGILVELSDSAESNAALIVAAWNACVTINAEDPIRAAETILPAFEALKKIANCEFDSTSDGAATLRELARRVFPQTTERRPHE